MYEMSVKIPFTQSGKDGKIKLHHAVAMMMDCCQFQEYQEAAFKEYLTANHLAIFLLAIQLDIFRMPAFREEVKAAVRIYGCRSIYGLRRLTIRDAAGRLCLMANAAGAFFDLRAGRAAKLDTAALPLKFDPPEPMECLPRKIPVPRDNGRIMPAYAVNRSDLDPNGHLTSPIYAAIADNALPPDFTYNRVRMEFKSQTPEGAGVTPVLYDAGGGTIIADLRNGEKNSAAAAEFSTADLSAEVDN